MIEKKGSLKFPRTRQVYHGQAIGILMFNDGVMNTPEKDMNVPVPIDYFTRVPGDVGNATTFNFPVQYKPMVGVAVNDMINTHPTEYGKEMMEKYCRELEKEGVRAIATTCGLFSYFQDIMRNAVDIPVFSSALLQVPMVSKLIPKDKKIAILTADSRILTPAHLEPVGIDDSIPYVMWGMERFADNPEYTLWTTEVDPEKRREELERRLIHAVEVFSKENPDIGAIVLECTNMPPASAAIQKATGLPVYDVVTMINLAYNSVVQKRFTGFM